MTLSLLKILRAGPPPPKVVLLPDALFFTRSIAVPPGSTLAEVTGQVEVALETLSPFPPAQLYHGFYWPAGADRAFVFAAYRRRFTSEQLAGWDGAELVLPSVAALLGGDIKPNTTMVVPSDEGFTAVYWDESPVPAKVVFRAMQPDATDADRTRAQEQLFSAAPRSRQIVLTAPPVPVTSVSDRDLVFNAESFTSRLPAAQAGALDVRDKTALAAMRRARKRDLALWRGFLGLIAMMLILGLAEFGLVAAGVWQKNLLAQVNAQRPVVEKVMMAQQVTTRINELSTKRLLPFEMIGMAMEARPKTPTGDSTVQFVRASTVNLYELNVDAKSTSPTAPSAYQAALTALPAVEKVEMREQKAIDTGISFTVAVTFRAAAIKPNAVTP